MSHPPNIGPYTVEREIARGGMGVVYLAHDSRLDRTVAIKSLPADLAENPERLARFEREAKALAALNHTNIAGIHSVEEFKGARYLVLEYVEGLTLSQRIEQGPLQVVEALELGAQIAQGVEAAHEAGVIHRDLKPGNIIIRTDGVVKVVDFGLAKEIESRTSSLDITNMPTVTTPNEPATAMGQVLGTPEFLSPEQARGKPIDRRTDIWSFGCVLFECLTGDRLFGGETTTDALAAILEREPRWDALPETTPPRIRELLASCLEKDPRSRLRDIGDARLELERALTNKEWSSTSLSAYHGAIAKKRSWVGPSIVTAMVGFALGAGAMLLMPGDENSAPAGDHRTLRYEIDVTDGSGQFQTISDLAINNDGSMIAYKMYDGSERDLESLRTVYVRDFSALEPRAIPGAEMARDIFFSPDGKRLGMHTGEAIRSVSVQGGPLTTIRQDSVTVVQKLRWVDPDRIIYPTGSNVQLMELMISDGSVRPIFEASGDNGYLGIENTCSLPNGNGMLICGWVGHTVESYRISHLATDGTVTTLVDDAGGPCIVGGRYLVFIRRSTLFAARFDCENARLLSDPVPVLDGIKAFQWGGGGQFVVSPNGDLVYQPGARTTTDRRLVWVGMDGDVTPAIDRSDSFLDSVAVSGDGRYAVVSTLRNKNELWRIHLESGARDRLWDTGEPDNAILSHDGSKIAFTSPPIGAAVGAESRLVILDYGASAAPVYFEIPGCLLWPRSWVDGKQRLLFSRYNLSERNNDLMLLDLETMEYSEYLATEHNEYDATISPDGKWLAYGSNRSGEHNLYLRSFPDGALDRLITPGGAWGKPYWSGDSSTIYFAHNDRMRAVDITTSPAFSVDVPRTVFTWPWADGLNNDDQVWLAPDNRFLMVEPAEWEKQPPKLIVVQNWLAELDERFGFTD